MRRASFLAVVGARLWRKRPAAAVVARNTDRMERTRYARGELCYRCAYVIVDPSHEDEIETKVFTLRRSIQRFEDVGETQRAQIAREDLEGWKHVLTGMRSDLAALAPAERAQVREAARIVKAYRMHRRSGNIPLGTTILGALAVAIIRKRVNWVLDADIRGFFDTIDHGWLAKFVEHRIADERVLRLIQKWLRAGVIEDGVWTASDEGTPQGASISALLANVYLHYVFDLWVHQWRSRHAHGDVIVVRYADDFVVGFERRRPSMMRSCSAFVSK